MTMLARLPPASIALQTRRDQHPVTVYLARLAPGSRRTMRGALERIAQLIAGDDATALALPWHELRYQHTQAIRARLAEAYAPATVNKTLAALRGVLRECWRLGQLDAEAFQRASDVASLKAAPLPRGRSLAVGELTALMHACAVDPGAGAARDAALVAVLHAGGLRRAEIVALDVADYTPATGTLAVRSGKGRKARLVYMDAGAAQALLDWLAIRGDEPGPLFCPVHRSGRVHVRRLTTQAVLEIARRLAAKAHVQRFSPHDLRRTFVGDLLDAGADISTVQQLAGHASVQTTQRYDRRPEAVKRAAARLLHTPYFGRPARRPDAT